MCMLFLFPWRLPSSLVLGRGVWFVLDGLFDLGEDIGCCFEWEVKTLLVTELVVISAQYFEGWQ